MRAGFAEASGLMPERLEAAAHAPRQVGAPERRRRQ
jgi:hypothetical protein